jgi:hypothetical protein
MIVRMMDPIASSEGFEPWIFVGPNAERESELFYQVAVWNGVTFREINRMLKIAIYGTENVPPEMKELLADQARLNEPKYYPSGLPNDFEPTIPQLLEIRERARRAIEWRAVNATDPAERERLEALLEPSPVWKQVQRQAAAQIVKQVEQGGHRGVLRDARAVRDFFEAECEEERNGD